MTGNMAHKREIKTCNRCRLLKLRCDRTKPSCQRCAEAHLGCTFSQQPSSTSITDTQSSTSSTGTSAPMSASLDNSSPTQPTSMSNEGHNRGHDISKDNPAAGSDSVKKRQRAHLSCARCRRLKVKCNKDLPCSRCRASGWGRNCAYNHRAYTEKLSSEPSVQDMGEAPDKTLGLWHSQPRSRTHWKQLISAVKLEAGLVDIPVQSIIREAISHKNLDNTADSVLPSNFPFNSPGAAKYRSLNKVHELLQSHRERSQSYVDGYLALYHSLYPIIDVPEFYDATDKFWNDPSSVEASWLAGFLTVLALGCFVVSRDQDTTRDLCMAAEACLSKTPFMIQPDLAVMRSLCLMVVAKQTANATCRTFDSCWTFLGIVTRAAVSMDLNRQSSPRDQSAKGFHEWQSGQVLWSVIVYFCIQMAVVTGKPPLTTAGDVVATHVPLSYDNEPIDPWMVLLYQVYPTICHIVARMNSDTETLSYSELMRFEGQIRHLMGILDTIHGRPSLYIALNIFFRRILLSLHRQNAVDPRASLEYPVSYKSSLECSLAILVHHRDLCEPQESGGSDMELLGRLFKLDFFSAMLTACLYLLRGDAPLAMEFEIPPRRIILDTLQVCTEIWRQETRHSICFRIGHILLTAILEPFEDTSQ